MNADRLQLVAPRVCDRGFPAIGEHDRRAVGSVQRKQLQSRRDRRRLGEQARHVLGTDLLHIGDMALTQARQRRSFRFFIAARVSRMLSLCHINRKGKRVKCRRASRSEMLVV